MFYKKTVGDNKPLYTSTCLDCTGQLQETRRVLSLTLSVTGRFGSEASCIMAKNLALIHSNIDYLLQVKTKKHGKNPTLRLSEKSKSCYVFEIIILVSNSIYVI